MYTPRYLKRVPRIVSSFLEPSYLVTKQPYLAFRGSYLATTQPPARYNMSFCGFTKGEEYRDHFQHGKLNNRNLLLENANLMISWGLGKYFKIIFNSVKS